MYHYEQHCPIARTAELLTEPWTLLVLRELMRGSERRVDIAKGLPKMSQALLGARLRTLESSGVVTHLPGDRGEKRYRLTAAGLELRPLVEQLGRWGQRWLDRPRIGDLNAELLVYDICREINEKRLPDTPLTVDVNLTDAPPPRRWWIELSNTGATAYPRTRDTDATVQLAGTIGGLAAVWLGHQTWLQAVRERTLVLSGNRAAVRSLVGCLGASRYAAVPRADTEREPT